MRGQERGGEGTRKREHNREESNFGDATTKKSDEVPYEYLVENYPYTNKYQLGTVNSIFCVDGRIYDLLDGNQYEKPTKCGCVKSFCQAKYCECFRKGKNCTDLCSCEGCQNIEVVWEPKVKKESTPICHCQKSGCIKKYCECFQQGRICSSECKCVGCKNQAYK